MNKLYNLLKIIMWCFVGVFIGSTIYKCYDYKTYPDLHAAQSAPWYLGIEIQGVFTAIIVILILIAMWAIRKKSK